MSAAIGLIASIRVTSTVVVVLLAVATLVAVVANRLRLPYTVALVVVGATLGALRLFRNVGLTEDLILLVFLPPLLFDAAVSMDLAELRRRWNQVALLAVVGTIVSAGVVAAALVVAPGMATSAAVLLGVIVAPTDPVSVLAVLKDASVRGGLHTLLEGESIFNDALGIVLFVVAIRWAVPEGRAPIDAAHAAARLVQEVGVGAAIGLAVGIVAHQLMIRLDDHLVEITVSIVTAYGTYLLADRLGGSGVLGTVVAGLVLGARRVGRRGATEAHWVALAGFWEVMAFLANSAIFLLIGLRFRLDSVTGGRTLAAIVVTLVAMFVGRALLVYGLLRPFRRFTAAAPIPEPWLVAVFWGGLRGSIPIALVLGLGRQPLGGVDPIGVVFGVVVFSLVVQGVTYRPLIGRLGLAAGN